jgi:hypothetical protein
MQPFWGSLPPSLLVRLPLEAPWPPEPLFSSMLAIYHWPPHLRPGSQFEATGVALLFLFLRWVNPLFSLDLPLPKSLVGFPVGFPPPLSFGSPSDLSFVARIRGPPQDPFPAEAGPSLLTGTLLHPQNSILFAKLLVPHSQHNQSPPFPPSPPPLE